jgi:hypothetical protein
MTQKRLLKDSMSIEELQELERSVVKTDESLVSIRQKYSEMNASDDRTVRSTRKSIGVRNADPQRQRVSLSDYTEASDSELDEYRSRRRKYRHRRSHYRSRRSVSRSWSRESGSDPSVARAPGAHVLKIPGSISRKELDAFEVEFTGVDYYYDPVDGIVSYLS